MFNLILTYWPSKLKVKTLKYQIKQTILPQGYELGLNKYFFIRHLLV